MACYAGGDNKDPAWVTCAVAAGAVPLYSTLFLAPTKSGARLDGESACAWNISRAERESRLVAWVTSAKPSATKQRLRILLAMRNKCVDVHLPEWLELVICVLRWDVQ
jgi:hypothetical protein